MIPGSRHWEAAVLVVLVAVSLGVAGLRGCQRDRALKQRWLELEELREEVHAAGEAAPPTAEGEDIWATLGGAAGTTIDLNRARFEDLMAIPGIGPTLARDVIAYRDQHGAFASMEALAQVPGVGERTLERLRLYLHVETASAPASPTSPPPTPTNVPTPATHDPPDPPAVLNPTPTPAPSEPSGPNAVRATFVNINTASLEVLMTLDGIGEVRARAIIEYRERRGPFNFPRDIMRVQGIGEKTWEANKYRIIVGP